MKCCSEGSVQMFTRNYAASESQIYNQTGKNAFPHNSCHNHLEKIIMWLTDVPVMRLILVMTKKWFLFIQANCKSDMKRMCQTLVHSIKEKKLLLGNCWFNLVFSNFLPGIFA